MMEILDPTTEAATQTTAYAPRPTGLDGKRVALVQNTKYNSDRLLARIGDLLKTVKLDFADLNEHIALEKTGFWKQFRITPDDPRAFKAAVDEALAAYRARSERK